MLTKLRVSLQEAIAGNSLVLLELGRNYYRHLSLFGFVLFPKHLASVRVTLANQFKLLRNTFILLFVLLFIRQIQRYKINYVVVVTTRMQFIYANLLSECVAKQSYLLKHVCLIWMEQCSTA